MRVGVRIDNVPANLYGELVGAHNLVSGDTNYESYFRHARVWSILQDGQSYEAAAIRMGEHLADSASRREIRDNWSSSRLREIAIDFSSIGIEEETNEQEDEGFAPDFTLRGWSRTSGLSRLWRERAQFGDNSGEGDSEVDLPQSELSAERDIPSTQGSYVNTIWRSAGSSIDLEVTEDLRRTLQIPEYVYTPESVRTTGRTEGSRMEETDAERSERIRQERSFQNLVNSLRNSSSS